MENQNPNPEQNQQKTQEVKPPVINTTVTENQFTPEKEEAIPLTVNTDDNLDDLGFLGKSKKPAANLTSESSGTPPPFVGQPKVMAPAITPMISSDGKINAETVRSGIKMLIIVIDYLMASALRWYAKDTIDTPYKADTSSKKALEDSLCELLVQQQTKMPIWLIVLLSFLASFAGGAIMAYNHRSKVLAAQERLANLPPNSGKIPPPPTTPPVVPVTPSVTPVTPAATQITPPVGNWSKTPTLLPYEELKKIYGRLVEDVQQEFSTTTGRPRYGFYDRIKTDTQDDKWELRFNEDGTAKRSGGNPRQVKLKYA